MLSYLFLDIICSSQLTARFTALFSEQIMSADKYPSIFSRQIGATVNLDLNNKNMGKCQKKKNEPKHSK